MFDVQIALEGLAEARREWSRAMRAFNADSERVLIRLLHEAAANYMSVEQVAKFSGLAPKRIRTLMRDNGLNPRDGKRVLAKHAAEALQSNAELLGIAPHQMDLMSPLAYLPAGSVLRQELTDKTTAGVTELEDEHYDWCKGSCGGSCGRSKANLRSDELEDVSGNATHSGYPTIAEAVHDLHLRGGRLRPHATCPTCHLVGEA